MRAFLRSSPVAPQRSRALAEATRLDVAGQQHRGVGDGGDSLPRVQRPAGLLRVAHRQVGGTVSSEQSTTTAAGLGSATRIRSRSRGKPVLRCRGKVSRASGLPLHPSTGRLGGLWGGTRRSS